MKKKRKIRRQAIKESRRVHLQSVKVEKKRKMQKSIIKKGQKKGYWSSARMKKKIKRRVTPIHFGSKKTYPFFLILFGISMALLVRFALIPQHERGVDGWSYHLLTKTILDLGYAPWFSYHPLAYLGLYPFSDSCGIFLVTATISSLTSLNIEVSILFLSLIEGMLLFIVGYALGMAIKRNCLFATIVGYTLSFAPILFTDSIWGFSPRVLSIVTTTLVPMLLILGLKNKDKRMSFIVLAVLFEVISVFIHLLAIIGGLFFIAFILIIAANRLKDRFAEIKPILKRAIAISYIVAMFALIYFLRDYVNLTFLQNYETGAIISGGSPAIEMINIAISLVGGVGIVWLAFGLFGILHLFLKDNRNDIENFLFFSLLIVIPLLLIRGYVRPFVPILLLPTTAIGAFLIVRWFRKLDRKKLVSGSIACILIAAPPGFAVIMYEHFASSDPSYKYQSPSEDVVASSLYFDSIESQKVAFVSNNPFIELQVAGYDKHIPAFSALAIYYGNKTLKELWISGGGPDIRSYQSELARQMSLDSLNLMFHPVTSIDAKYYIQKYHIKYVIQDKELGNNIPGYGYQGERLSEFIASLSESQYKIFENNRIIIWEL